MTSKAPARQTVIIGAICMLLCAVPMLSMPVSGETAARDSCAKFEELFKLASSVNDLNELVASARREEAAGRYDSACAQFLAASLEMLRSGNMQRCKPLIEKLGTVGGKLDASSKRFVINQLFDAGQKSLKQKRSLTADYLFSAALSLKEQSLEDDDQLLSLLLNVASARALQSQYPAAETLYKRAIAKLEAGQSLDEARLSSAQTALAGVYARRGAVAEAISLLERVLSRLPGTANGYGLNAVGEFLQLSQLYQRAGNSDKAVQAVEQAVQAAAAAAAAGDVNAEQAENAAELLEDFAKTISAGENLLQNQADACRVAAFKLKLKADGLEDSLLTELDELSQHLYEAGRPADVADLYKLVRERANAEAEQDKVVKLYLRKVKVRESYVKALRAAGRTEELAEVEAEIRREQAARRRAAEEEAEKRLADAKKHRDVDPESYAEALMHVAIIRLSSERVSESLSMAKEAIAIFHKNDKAELTDEFLSSAWDYAVSWLNARDSGNKDERIIYDIAALDEKHIADNQELGRVTDLSEVLAYFKDKQRFNDAEAFVRHVLALRKKHRGYDLVALYTGYEALNQIYAASGDQKKYDDTRELLLNFIQVRYKNNEPKTIPPRAAVVLSKIQQGKLDEAVIVMDQVLITAENLKENAYSDKFRTEALIPVRRLVEVLVANDRLEEAGKFLKRAIELIARGSSKSDYVWLRLALNRLVDAYCRKGEFAGAEEILKADLDGRQRRAGNQESDEVAASRLRLSEVLLLHGCKLKEQGKQSDAQPLLSQSLDEFSKARSFYEQKGGADLLKLRRAARKREAILASVPLHRRGSMPALSIRHHLSDVLNQKIDNPREPLTFALFGRSEVVLCDHASTWSCNSSSRQPVLVDTDGDVGGMGLIKLCDESVAHGTLSARSVVILQKQANCLETLNAKGNAPRAYPLPPPLKPPDGGKIVEPIVKDGVISCPQNSAVCDLGCLIIEGGKAIKIEPGDYIASCVVLKGRSKLAVVDRRGVDGDPTKLKSVRIFLKEKSDSGNCPQAGQMLLDENAQLNADGKPAQLQIWTSSDQILQVQDHAVVHGIVYAPYSLLSVDGNAKIFGSFVADEIRLSGNVKAVYDTQLPQPKQLGLPAFVVRPLGKGVPLLDREDAGAITVGIDPERKEREQTNLLLSKGKITQALERSVAAVKKEPCADNYALLSRCFILQKQYAAAIEQCNAGIALDSRHPYLYALRGEALELNGEKDKASADFKKALELMPVPESDSDLLIAAVCRIGLGQADQGVELLNECISIKSDNPLPYVYRARAYQLLNKPDLAGQDQDTVKRLIDGSGGQKQSASK